MKSKLILTMFALTAFLISLSLVSAALELTATSIPTSVSHTAGNVQVLFNLENTGATDETGLVWDSDKNVGEWTVIPTVTDISAGATLSLSAVLALPPHSSGTINAEISVDGEVLDVTIPIDASNTLEVVVVEEEITETQSGEVTIKNTGNVNLNDIELTSTGKFEVTFSSNDIALAPGTNLGVTVTGVDLSELDFGDNKITILAKDSIEGSEATAVLKSVNGFCENGSIGDLEITKIDIESDGDDDDTWRPLDIITVEVEVENNGDDDINDVFVELGLFDSDGKNQINDVDFENSDEEEFDVGDLDDGDDDTIAFTFQVPPDFDDGNYKLAIKVYGDDDGEDEQCADISDDFDDSDFYRLIEVEREDDEGKFIAFDNIEIRPTREVTCGDTVTVDLDVFNIGDEEQEQVKVNLFSNDFNLMLDREIREDLEEGESEEVSFTFIVPEGLEDKLYRLELNADYDYNRGSYRESSDEDTIFTLNVIGCSILPPGADDKVALITARLDSDAKAGEELLVRASVTSLVTGQKDFVIRATGFESWGSLNSISERLVNLNEGQSKEIVLSFNVNPDVEGEQSFDLEVISGESVESREIAVNIESTSNAGFDFGDNSLIWIIGIINVILIVLIIVVAARISRK